MCPIPDRANVCRQREVDRGDSAGVCIEFVEVFHALHSLMHASFILGKSSSHFNIDIRILIFINIFVQVLIKKNNLDIGLTWQTWKSSDDILDKFYLKNKQNILEHDNRMWPWYEQQNYPNQLCWVHYLYLVQDICHLWCPLESWYFLQISSYFLCRIFHS